MEGKKQGFEPDPDIRDYENISLPKGFIEMSDDERIKAVGSLAEQHLHNAVHPYVSDAWIDHSKTKFGYEIPFTRQFYTYTAPRPVGEIRGEIESLEQQIQAMMKELK
jgi:type I restriction enzyme M protein